MGPVRCDRCGSEIWLGDWPWCPHERGRSGAVSDAIPGGQWIENLGPEPVLVYSETERRRLMKARGLRDAVRHTPGSRLTSNWDVPSAQTLADGAALVSGERRGRAHPSAEIETLELTTRVLETGFSVAPDGEPHT